MGNPGQERLTPARLTDLIPDMIGVHSIKNQGEGFGIFERSQVNVNIERRPIELVGCDTFNPVDLFYRRGQESLVISEWHEILAVID